MKPTLVSLLILALCQACQSGVPQGAELSDYEQTSEAFLTWYFEAHPIRSTQLGLHQYDAELPDWSAAGVAARVQALHAWQRRLGRLNAQQLSAQDALDLRILEHRIGAELLELERVQAWKHDPRHYNALLTAAIASLAEREFAPLAQRLQSMQARMARLPGLLLLAREQLEQVPMLWLEMAQRNGRGSLRFLEQDLLAMLEAQGLEGVEGELLQAWNAARLGLIAAVREHSSWLDVELCKRAAGDFRLGRELFEEKLRLEEFVDLDCDQLWEMNEEAILRYQRWATEVAAEIDPNLSVAQVMELVTADFPSPETLIETARSMLLETRDFIVAKNLVSLPSDLLPSVRSTPDYARQGFASMSTPGAFEHVAKEAYYNITNVDAEWSPEQQAEHMTYFNYPGLLGITVHEAMPGHFVQLLYEQRIPSRVRRIFTAASLVEGWAHYAEQMMVDEGLRAGDPKVRLGQLRRALQRHARWYAGLALHVKGVSIEDAAKRFEEIAYFAPFPALREVQRASYDPTYLYYALGRMQILALRAELEARAERSGEAFDLCAFHDQFLTLGLPAPLAREFMLAD